MRGRTQSLARAARPVTRRWRDARSQELVVLGWHRLGPAPDYPDDGLTTPVEGFVAQLDLLAERGAAVLPLEEALARRDAGTLPPRAVTLTFDDGYASVTETAWPLLRERGWPATLYVVSGVLDGLRDFSWDGGRTDDLVRLSTPAELRAAAEEGLAIGSHTVTHPWLPTLGEAALTDQVRRSRERLEDWLAAPVTSFAYPMGGWTPQVLAATRAAGYASAITCDRGAVAPRRDPLLLRRDFAPDTAADLGLVLDGAYAWLRPFDTLRRRAPEPAS